MIVSTETIIKIAVVAPPVMFAIILHEVAHGWIADKLGDPTARNLGRLTLNPLRHIDLFGTIIMPLVLFALTYKQPSGPIVFGYAKPVPINPYNFKNPKRDMALSSFAGPGLNILFALLCTFVVRVALPALDGILPQSVLALTGLMFLYGVIINVVLAVLNLIPLPPLDGSRIAYWLLPEQAARAYYRLERFGMIIILVLFASGLLGKIILPIIRPTLRLLLGEELV